MEHSRCLRGHDFRNRGMAVAEGVNPETGSEIEIFVSLHVDEAGTVWAGTWGGGLAHFDGKTWKNYTMADGLPANHVFMLEGAGNGAMWVGTSNGMAYFDGQRFDVLTTKDGLYANNVFSLARGDDGSLWVGSYGGVARLVGLSERFGVQDVAN